MASGITASRLADLVRVAVATHVDLGAAAGDNVFVTVRFHEGEDHALGQSSRGAVRSIVVRRLYCGRNKGLENDSLWDVLVGAELTQAGLLRGTFTYLLTSRVSIHVAPEPPVPGADAFEGVFGLKKLDVAPIR